MVKETLSIYKIVVNMSPNYLYNYVSTVNQSHQVERVTNFYIYVAEQNI